MILKSAHSNLMKLKNTSLPLSKLIINNYSAVSTKPYFENYNLRFDTNDWHVNLYPFFPEVQSKGNNIYEVSDKFSVLALNFLKKDLVIFYYI